MYKIHLLINTICLSLLLNIAIAADKPVLRLATTTSTENSGLLKVLLPPFEKSTGYTVQTVAVGSGKALKMGQDGDADVLMVHDPIAEKTFVAEKHGVNWRSFMYNDFLVVGSAQDPAKIQGMKDVAAAFKQIHATPTAVFISRGDKSGTHVKELELWAAAGVKPTGAGYREAGQGMGAVVQMAGELEAYTLVDRGTWLSMKAKSPLKEMVAGDARLFNPYSVIAVNPSKYKDINYAGAMALITWVTSVEGQQVIRDFKINGEPLFVPTAIEFK